MTIGSGQPGANPKGGVDVNVQDQTSPLFQYFLIQEQKTDILLTADVAKDDTIINVSAGHGFTAAAGEYITIWENNRYLQEEVISVATNAISIATPIAYSFTTAGAIVVRGNKLMNINGSVTPVDFLMRIQNFTIPIDISRTVLTMFHTTAGDDGKFGGIAALPNGLWFRKEDGFDFNLGNYKTNQDFKNIGGEVTYTAKGPAGINATDVTLDLRDIFGQVIRMDSRDSDVFRSQVRDNLATNMSSCTISMIGSYTEGE